MKPRYMAVVVGGGACSIPCCLISKYSCFHLRAGATCIHAASKHIAMKEGKISKGILIQNTTQHQSTNTIKMHFDPIEHRMMCARIRVCLFVYFCFVFLFFVFLFIRLMRYIVTSITRLCMIANFVVFHFILHVLFEFQLFAYKICMYNFVEYYSMANCCK